LKDALGHCAIMTNAVKANDDIHTVSMIEDTCVSKLPTSMETRAAINT